MAPMALLAAAAACAHALVPGSPSCGRAVLRRRGVRFQGPGVGSSFPAHDGGGDAPGARGALKGVILGGGSFGLAMACVLGRAGVPATLLVRSRADADYLNARGRHPKHLPDVDLPEGTRATADAAEALRGASFLVHCVPVQHSRRYLRKIAKHVPPVPARPSFRRPDAGARARGRRRRAAPAPRRGLAEGGSPVRRGADASIRPGSRASGARRATPASRPRRPGAPVLCTSKGIERKTLGLMCEILPAQLGEDRAYAFLSGPSFAREIAEGPAPRRRRPSGDASRRSISAALDVDAADGRTGRARSSSSPRSARAGARTARGSARAEAAPRSAASRPGLATAVVVASEDRGAAADFRALLAPARRSAARPGTSGRVEPGRGGERSGRRSGGSAVLVARSRRGGGARVAPVGRARAGRGPTAARRLASDTFRVFTSADVVGLEVGGAVKNVLALAAGMAEGLDLGTNAVTALVTRGLYEMQRIALAMGGRASTIMGLSGVGDTFGTCFGPLSRNRGTGLRLGRGERLDDILADLGEVADRADIDRRHGRFRQNFTPLHLGHIAADSADVWTDRSLSSSSRSAAEELASRPSRTRALKSG